MQLDWIVHEVFNYIHQFVILSIAIQCDFTCADCWGNYPTEDDH